MCCNTHAKSETSDVGASEGLRDPRETHEFTSEQREEGMLRGSAGIYRKCMPTCRPGTVNQERRGHENGPPTMVEVNTGSRWVDPVSVLQA